MAGSKAGAINGAAARLGMTVAEYEQMVASGQKHCRRCRTWHPRAAFGADKSRSDGLMAICSSCKNAEGRARYVPVPHDQRKPMGPPRHDPRPGDKKQARHFINLDVKFGKRPRPNTLPCADCGHVGGDRRHEYDHFLGYAPPHHADVEVVCSVCHRRRTEQRGELIQVRDSCGRYARKEKRNG